MGLRQARRVPGHQGPVESLPAGTVHLTDESDDRLPWWRG